MSYRRNRRTKGIFRIDPKLRYTNPQEYQVQVAERRKFARETGYTQKTGMCAFCGSKDLYIRSGENPSYVCRNCGASYIEIKSTDTEVAK